MPRDIFPTLGIPTIYVAQPYGGMDPAQMEGYLTYYYEYHFLYITGIEHVESKSIQGAALLKLQFHPGTDMSQAMSETVAYVNRARAFMPPGTVPPFVMRFDAGSVPVGNLVFSSASRTVGEMQDLALNRVRPLFATLPGVSAPPPFGGSARSIVINLKPERLRAYNMSPGRGRGGHHRGQPDQPFRQHAHRREISDGAAQRRGQEHQGPGRRCRFGPGRSRPFFCATWDRWWTVRTSSPATRWLMAIARSISPSPSARRPRRSRWSIWSRPNLPKFQSVLPADVKVSYEFDQSPYVTRAIGGLTLEGALGAVLTGPDGAVVLAGLAQRLDRRHQHSAFA